MKSLCAGFNRLEHIVERLDGHRNQLVGVEVPSLGGTATAEYQTNSQTARDLEDYLRGIEPETIAEEIVVIRNGGRPGQQHLGKPDTGGDGQRLLVDLRPERIGHRAKPAGEGEVDAAPHALQDALEQVMMGRYQAGIEDAAPRIEPALGRGGLQFTDFNDHAIANADRTAGPHRGTGTPAENPGRILDQQGGHVSAPISLSCQFDNASLDRRTIAPNNPTPVSVIRNSAANMRGISIVNPASKIS